MIVELRIPDVEPMTDEDGSEVKVGDGKSEVDGRALVMTVSVGTGVVLFPEPTQTV